MNCVRVVAAVIVGGLGVAFNGAAQSQEWGVSQKGDELGNAKALGDETWARCAAEMAKPGAQSYELSHIRSNTMPSSPFGAPLEYTFRPTVGLPGTKHAFNGENVTGEPGAQATQMDALGHFGFLNRPWDGEGEFPSRKVKYFGGYKQKDVKPNAESALA
ncbi:MAG: cyclase family protein, partial [Pseudomonadota bacterium]